MKFKDIKWNILPALLAFLLAQATGMYALGKLERFDYTLVTFRGTVTRNDMQVVSSAFGRAAESAVFTRSENTYVSDRWNDYEFATVYGCSEIFFDIANIKPVSGRTLWDSDSNEGAKYTVIDYNLAVRLFAGKDCLGEMIKVGNAWYMVVGVCTAEDGILTSVDEYAVYLPMDEYLAPDTKSGCLLRPKNDSALAFALQGEVSVAGGIQSVDNLKIRSGMWSMPVRLSFFIVWAIALLYSIRLAVKYFDLRIRRMRAELDDLYPAVYIKKNIAGIVLHAVVLLVLCGIFALWYRAVRFTVTLDASLIPGSLINMSEWEENIRTYMRYRNSAYFVPFSPSHKISSYGKIALVSSVVYVFAAWLLIRKSCRRTLLFLNRESSTS
ncbi:MAG: ABC transporter permease [Clostridiales bacterium]|nr:ABC transporter permease [Clostridiales bacterium]